MIGAERGIDPYNGHHCDDTKRYIEASKILSDADRHQVYEGNTRRVYPRLDAALKAKRRYSSLIAESRSDEAPSFKPSTA